MMLFWRDFAKLTWQDIERVIDMVPEGSRSRRVLIAFYRDGKTIPVIAQEVDVSRARVRVVMYEAFAELAYHMLRAQR